MMGKFVYTARTDGFEVRQGAVEADSELEAIGLLSRQGCYPLSLVADEGSMPRRGTFPVWRSRRKEVAGLTRQLAILLTSGVPVVEGLDLLGRQAAVPYMQSVIMEISGRIREGASLSEAMAAYPEMFTRLYVALVHAGEVSGDLEGAMQRLADFLEKEEELRDELMAAMTYPLFIGGVSLLTMVVLIGFVMPKLVVMFEDMGQVLPLSTMLLISLSRAWGEHWWLLLGGAGAVGAALFRYYGTEAGRYVIDGMKLRVAFLGGIIVKAETGCFMRTLSLLLSGGVETVMALDVAAAVINNRVMRQEASEFKAKILEGGSLSACLRSSSIFPSFAANIVAVGEESGEMEKALLNVAQVYERDVDRTMKAATRLLEPVIILLMGAVVGFIVFAMLMPIFQMNLSAQ